MFIRHKKFILFIFLIYLLPGVMWASDDHSLVTMGVGYLGIFDAHKKAIGTVEYRLSYRLYKLRPWVSIEGTDREFYISGGFLIDIPLGKYCFLTPSLGTGIYSESSGLDLGSPVEFRSAIEISYLFTNSTRLGLSFSHISNGHFASHNPGTEILKIVYTLPLNF